MRSAILIGKELAVAVEDRRLPAMLAWDRRHAVVRVLVPQRARPWLAQLNQATGKRAPE